MDRIYYKDKDNQVSSFDNKQGYNLMCKEHPGLINLVKIGYDEAYAIANPIKTQKQLIAEVRSKYDKAIQKVCAENLLNDINSARNLAMLDASPLHNIAMEIVKWELKQQIVFINLLSDIENGKIIANKATFNDNFIDFNSNE